MNLNSEVNEAIERYDRERERATKITASLSAMPGGAPDPHKWDKLLILGEDANNTVDRYYEVRREVEAAINTLPDSRHRRVLSLTFLDFQPVGAVADAMHYSPRHIRRLKTDAILQLLSLNVLPNR